MENIEFASNEVFGKVYDGKGVRFDLHCVDQNGTRFIVEMQIARVSAVSRYWDFNQSKRHTELLF